MTHPPAPPARVLPDAAASGPAAAIPAATLVLLRDAGSGGAPALLMVERARAMAFAPGALVFPGGRIDPGDRALAATIDGSEQTAAKIAAIRETIEEAGVPIGLAPAPAPHHLAAIRAALHAGVAFGDLLARHALVPDPAQLVPFARWRPSHLRSHLFDTRFFLARMPPDAPPGSVDGTENVRLAWGSARSFLDAADAGAASLIFPTRRNLERLAQFASFDEAAAHARATPVRTVTPWIETRDGADHLCIPDDLGYPVTAQPVAGAARG